MLYGPGCESDKNMNDEHKARLEGIHNFRLLDERSGTAGQPADGQFSDIGEAGFEVVINLAMPDSDNASAEEGRLVAEQGMSYVHIPVDFESPRVTDYELFRSVMEGCRDRSVFVHCAANKRVSVFLYLFRTGLGAPHEEAWRDVLTLWTPDPTWTNFIAEVRDVGSLS